LRLTSFLDDGCGLYIEGNDFGMHHHACSLYGYFGCAYLGDGNNYYNVARLDGQAGSLAEGMVFHMLYGQEPDIFPDEIGNAGGALLFLSQDGIGRGVQHSPLGYEYRAIHLTVPFGALIDEESTKSQLMARYVDFLWSTIHVGVDPDTTLIPQGGILEYDWSLVNNSGVPQSVWARSRVRLPGGTVLPLLGPVPVTLGPGQQVSGHRVHGVPANAPIGEYVYIVEVGVPPDSLIDQARFAFSVESGMRVDGASGSD